MTDNIAPDIASKTAPVRRPGRLLLAGLVLGPVFDLLFDGQRPGLSLLVFALLPDRYNPISFEEV